MKTIIPALLVTVSLSACAAPPAGHGGNPIPPPLQTLPLTATQDANLRTLLGLLPSSPFTVAVLDRDASYTLTAGDIAVTRGGITNGEISRRPLNRADVDTINGTASNPLAEAARQLQAAEAKWKQKRPQHYAYTLQRSCFCAPDYRKPIEIRVFKGKVQQASLLPENMPLPAERKAEALTIDGLFRMIHEAINNKAASVTVEYDSAYGYPTSISIDRDQMMADEEIYLSASNFKIASGLKPKQGW